jgi:protein-tyrosine-phosphatase
MAISQDAGASVFLMIRFREAEQFETIAKVLAETLDQYALALVRADYKYHYDELWANVRHCMDTSAYGIAIFEHMAEPTLSPNVSLELGYMLAKGKRCLLLKEKRVPSLQADLVGHLCHEFDSDRIPETVSAEVRHWLRDLGIAKRKDEKVVAFVSYSGTCRDPMAKAITLKLLESNPPDYPLRVEAGALFQPSAATASYAAREAIKELLGEDLLAAYRVTRMTAERIAEADLILVMAASLLQKNSLPPEKTFVLKPFFGLDGDVEDPFPDGKDEATLARYRRCAEELHEIILKNLGELIEFLRAETKANADHKI